MYTWDYFDLLKRRNLLIRLSKGKDLKPFTKDMIQSDLLLYDCLCEIGNVTSNFPFLVRTEASKRYQETKITSSMINPTSFQKILDLAVFLNRIQFPIIEKNYQNRKIGIVENGTWAPMAGKCMKEIVETMKNITICDTMVTIRSRLNEESRTKLEALAEEILR